MLVTAVISSAVAYNGRISGDLTNIRTAQFSTLLKFSGKSDNQAMPRGLGQNDAVRILSDDREVQVLLNSHCVDEA